MLSMTTNAIGTTSYYRHEAEQARRAAAGHYRYARKIDRNRAEAERSLAFHESLLTSPIDSIREAAERHVPLLRTVIAAESPERAERYRSWARASNARARRYDAMATGETAA